MSKFESLGDTVHTITERDGRFHVTFTGGSEPPTEKSFATLNRAKAWATRCEAAWSRYVAPRQRTGTVYNTTLGKLLERYGREVSAHKKGATAETYRINRLAQSALGGLRMIDVTSMALATYRDERRSEVSGSAIRSELSIIRRTIETARREWGYDIPVNPAALVTLPRPGAARLRRLLPGEYEKLERGFAGNPLVWAFVRFAVASAMRRGEMLSLRWRHVDLRQRLAHLPTTKSGVPRTVPLTDEAYAVLTELSKGAIGEYVFPIDVSAIRWAWLKACDAEGIEGLRIHDLRHEGVSRLFEMGLSVPEVALISGHKTVAMLFRYTHLLPLELARKLKGRKRETEPN